MCEELPDDEGFRHFGEYGDGRESMHEYIITESRAILSKLDSNRKLEDDLEKKYDSRLSQAVRFSEKV